MIARVIRSAAVRRNKIALSAWLGPVAQWRRRARDRVELAALSPRELSDIGITRSDVLLETTKWFWRR